MAAPGQYYGDHVVYVGAAASVSSASVSGVADLVVLSGAGSSIKVTNVGGGSPLFFTVSHPGGACPIPTVTGGQGVYAVGATANGFANVRHDGQFGSVVQVVSTGSPSYMVEVQSSHATS